MAVIEFKGQASYSFLLLVNHLEYQTIISSHASVRIEPSIINKVSNLIAKVVSKHSQLGRCRVAEWSKALLLREKTT